MSLTQLCLANYSRPGGEFGYSDHLGGDGKIANLIFTLVHRSTLLRRILRLISGKNRKIGEEEKTILVADLEDG
jgi:hypothetical protein